MVRLRVVARDASLSTTVVVCTVLLFVSPPLVLVVVVVVVNDGGDEEDGCDDVDDGNDVNCGLGDANKEDDGVGVGVGGCCSNNPATPDSNAGTFEVLVVHSGTGGNKARMVGDEPNKPAN
jgi:hypothetical protein